MIRENLIELNLLQASGSQPLTSASQLQMAADHVEVSQSAPRSPSSEGEYNPQRDADAASVEHVPSLSSICEVRTNLATHSKGEVIRAVARLCFSPRLGAVTTARMRRCLLENILAPQVRPGAMDRTLEKALNALHGIEARTLSQLRVTGNTGVTKHETSGGMEYRNLAICTPPSDAMLPAAEAPEGPQREACQAYAVLRAHLAADHQALPHKWAHDTVRQWVTLQERPVPVRPLHSLCPSVS